MFVVNLMKRLRVYITLPPMCWFMAVPISDLLVSIPVVWSFWFTTFPIYCTRRFVQIGQLFEMESHHCVVCFVNRMVLTWLITWIYTSILPFVVFRSVLLEGFYRYCLEYMAALPLQYKVWHPFFVTLLGLHVLILLHVTWFYMFLKIFWTENILDVGSKKGMLWLYQAQEWRETNCSLKKERKQHSVVPAVSM